MTSTLPAVIMDSVLAAGYLAILAWYDLELTGVVLLTLPLFAALMWFFTPAMWSAIAHAGATC